jgi:la-related protein 1
LDNLLKDMYLRRQMDSQGFVPLDFIAGFNRIKNLSTDIELVKLVCQQSSVVEYRTGEDGRDRLRRKDNWQQWVLNMDARDEVARNEGPKELHNPPVPHPTGFDQTQPPRWPMSATASVAPYGTDHSFPRLNGHEDTASTTETPLNDTTSDGSGDGAVPNGQSVERTTMAVSHTPYSFSNAASLVTSTTIWRKQNL